MLVLWGPGVDDFMRQVPRLLLYGPIQVLVLWGPGVDDFMRQVPQLLLYGPKKLYKCSCCGGPRCQLTPWLILKAMGSMPGPQCSS